jgi:hypothetical protein
MILWQPTLSRNNNVEIGKPVPIPDSSVDEEYKLKRNERN